MAQGDNKAKHEMLYVGTHEPTAMETLDARPNVPSEEVGRSVALSILSGDRGSMKPCPHIARRMRERNFDIFDFEYAIRNGKCIKREYCAEFEDFEYKFRCLIDGVEFDAVFALSAKHDLIKKPLMYLITGCWKTESGKRTTRY